ERAITAVQEERVALLLKLSLDVAWTLWQRGVRRHLRLEAMRVVTEHVDLEQVRHAVTVDVADVDAHCRIADLTLRGPVGETETALAVVIPELIGVLEVVREIEVWCAITVQIDELGA